MPHSPSDRTSHEQDPPDPPRAARFDLQPAGFPQAGRRQEWRSRHWRHGRCRGAGRSRHRRHRRHRHDPQIRQHRGQWRPHRLSRGCRHRDRRPARLAQGSASRPGRAMRRRAIGGRLDHQQDCRRQRGDRPDRKGRQGIAYCARPDSLHAPYLRQVLETGAVDRGLRPAQARWRDRREPRPAARRFSCPGQRPGDAFCQWRFKDRRVDAG